MAEQQLLAGQYDEAESNAKAALKQDPKMAGAYSVLAITASQRNQNDLAGEYSAKAADLAPQSGAVLNNYGAWLCGNGKATESLVFFERALADRSYPTPAAALANAGSCALGAGQPERAETALRSALAADPKSAVALAAMAELEYGKGNYLEARTFTERRLTAARPTSALLQLASQVETKLGDTAAAARYTQRLRTEFPNAAHQVEAVERP